MCFVLKWVSLTLVMVCILVASTARAQQQNKYKLKPGAEGKLCLSCHPDFETKLKSKFVHTPLKTAGCSECHNPHAANHGKLLSASIKTICVTCHEQVIPAKPISTRQVVVEGSCAKCHDPHASNNKANLGRAAAGPEDLRADRVLRPAPRVHAAFDERDAAVFLEGGTIILERLHELAERDDLFAVLPLVRQAMGIAVTEPDPTRLETALYRGVTNDLRKEGRDPLGTGLILEYLWRCSLEVTNLSLLFAGKDLARDEIGAELLY